MTTSIPRPWITAAVLGLVVAGASLLPAAQQPGKGGQTITVDPPADAEAVDKVPPLDKNGNFKVSTKGAWADVPALTVPKDVARGKVTKFAVKGDDSKFYPGSYSRNVWVYVPAGYKEGTELPLMVVHDGSESSNMQATLIAVLDTLIAGEAPARDGRRLRRQRHRQRRAAAASGRRSTTRSPASSPSSWRRKSCPRRRRPAG